MRSKEFLHPFFCVNDMRNDMCAREAHSSFKFSVVVESFPLYLHPAQPRHSGIMCISEVLQRFTPKNPYTFKNERG